MKNQHKSNTNGNPNTRLTVQIRAQQGKKKNEVAVPLFLPTGLGAEKGSVEIKEGRVSSSERDMEKKKKKKK